MAWIEKRGKKYRVYWDVGDGDNRKRRVESFDSNEDAQNFRKKIEYQQSIGIDFEPAKNDFWGIFGSLACHPPGQPGAQDLRKL